MLKRILTAIVIIAVVIAPLYYGGILINILVGVICAFGAHEMLQLNANQKLWHNGYTFVFLALLVASVLTPTNIGMMILLGLVLTIFAFPVFAKNFNSEDAMFFLGVCLLFFAFTKAFLIIYNYNHLYVYFVLLATYGTDTGAYFVGYFFGKTKLIPNISPKKTVEGAVGGWFCGVLLGLLFGLFVIKDMNLTLLLLGCIWIPVVSLIGDLAFSAF